MKQVKKACFGIKILFSNLSHYLERHMTLIDNGGHVGFKWRTQLSSVIHFLLVVSTGLRVMSK